MNWKEIATLRISGLNLNLADKDLIKTDFRKLGKLEPLNLQFPKLEAWPNARMFKKRNSSKLAKI